METIIQWLQFAIAVLSSLCVIIPLGYKLYKTTVQYTKEKNWPKLVEALSMYMQLAEEKLLVGADKKEWVLAMVRATPESINYELTESDITNLGNLIDQLCDMARVVNVGKIEEIPE